MDERMDMKPQKPGKSISPDIPRIRGEVSGRQGRAESKRERESVCIGLKFIMY